MTNKQIQRLKDLAEDLADSHPDSEGKKMGRDLRALLADYEERGEALKFYGNEENHWIKHDPHGSCSPVHRDYGRRARAALNQTDTEEAD